LKRIEYHVLEDFGMLLVVAAMCGGSADVRYGRRGPETRYVAELEPKPREKLWLFVHLPGDGHIAAQVEWHEGLWTNMASNGIQPHDCPFEVWTGSSQFFRTQNIPAELLSFEAAMRRHVEANPGTVRTAEFVVPE
jgi:hypothetical protein